MSKLEDEKVGFGAAVREYGDVAGILLVGGGFAIAAALGVKVSNEKLIAITLGVLAVLAVAIFKDRINQRVTRSTLDHVHTDMVNMGHIVTALQDGRPYHVNQQITRWDIATDDGSLVHVTRMKSLVFDQSEVAALYDFAAGDGHREYAYAPGDVVGEPFKVDNVMAHIVALGAVYSRGDKLNFELKRTVHNGYPGKRESVSVLTRDVIGLLRLEVLWPVGRSPSAIWRITTTASQAKKREDVYRDRKMEDGRVLYVLEINEPEKGGTTMIEWDW